MEENTNYLNIMDTTSSELTKSHLDLEETDRLKKFESSLHYAFKLIASGVSFEKFKDIYGGLRLMQRHPTFLVKLYKILKEKIEDNCVQNLNEMMAEAQLENKFDELAQIIERNAPYVGEKAWRPTGNVEDDVRSYSMVEKLKQVEELERKVLKKEAAVDSLITEVNMCREKARAIQSTIKSLASATEMRRAEEQQKIQQLTRLTDSLSQS